MSYFPLDRDLLTSSTWATGTPEQIKVWIYLMLAASPRDGTVEDAAPAIALRCGLSLSVVIEALSWLSSPDQHSRSTDLEGRKIEYVDGRIRLVNYLKRQDKDHSTPRVRAWRDRLRSGAKPIRNEVPPYPSVGDSCPCCGVGFQTPLKLYCVLDHDHATGAYRQYICQSCNKLIGQAENGLTVKPASVACIETYLKRHETVSSLHETVGNDGKGKGNGKEQTEQTSTDHATSPPAQPRAADGVEEQARLYVKVLDYTFGRRTRRVTPGVFKRWRSRLKDGWRPEELAALPILVQAQGKWTLKQKPDPEVLLRDGKNPKTRDGQTYGATDFAEKAYLNIDGTKLTSRQAQIATQANVLEMLMERGCVMESEE